MGELKLKDISEKNLDRQTRLDWLDMVRAVGIILMVAGHIGFGKIFDHYIHAYHMPLFFLFQGIYIKKQGLLKI